MLWSYTLEDFANGNEDINLYGEAFELVAKNPEVSFSVITDLLFQDWIGMHVHRRVTDSRIKFVGISQFIDSNQDCWIRMVFSDTNPDKPITQTQEASKQRKDLNQDYFPTGYTMKAKPVDYDKPMEDRVEPVILKFEKPSDTVKNNQNVYSNYVNDVPQQNIYDEMFKQRISEISNSNNLCILRIWLTTVTKLYSRSNFRDVLQRPPQNWQFFVRQWR
jgi:hypothetical protein